MSEKLRKGTKVTVNHLPGIAVVKGYAENGNVIVAYSTDVNGEPVENDPLEANPSLVEVVKKK